MKRVLCIVGGMDVGGAETFLMKIFRNIDKSKYMLDFAVGIESEGFYDKEIISSGGKIFHITPKSNGLLRNFNDIKNLVKKEHYEVVLRTSQSSASALELFAAKLGGAKRRVFRSSNTNACGGVKAQAVHMLCRFLPKWFSNIKVAPSSEAGIFMFGKKYFDKGLVEILNNGIDTNFYRYEKEGRNRIRQEFNIPEDAVVIGHIGRFSQQKNHEFLIELFNKFHNKHTNSYLLLAGTGELIDSIKTKVESLGISDYVLFVGVRNDTPFLYSSMDIFTFPSLFEGMPNTVIEAQACGLKCLVSDTVTKECNINNSVVFLPIDSVDCWVHELEQFFENDKFARCNFVNSDYSIDNVVKRFIEIVFGDKYD